MITYLKNAEINFHNSYSTTKQGFVRSRIDNLSLKAKQCLSLLNIKINGSQFYESS